MTRRPSSILLASAFGACLLATAACGDDDASRGPEAGSPSVRLDAYAAAGTQLAVLDAEGDALQLYEIGAAGDDEVPSARVDLPANPVLLQTRSGDRAEMLVLCAGLRGVDTPMQLVVVDADADARGYRLSLPYSSLLQSASGRFAVLRFEQGARTSVFSSAQLAVVDLDEPDAEPTELVLEVGGAPAQALWLPPALALGEQERQLALASGPRELALLDLAAPEQGPLRVTLSGERSLAERVTALAVDAARGRIAVLAEGLDDLTVIDLAADTDSARGYTVTVASYAAGTGPEALAFDADGSALVLSDDGAALYAIDPDSGDSTRHTLAARARALTSCEGCAFALLHAPLSRALTLVDLERLAAGDAAALRSLRLEAPVAEVLRDGEGELLRLVHEAGALTLVDLRDGTLVPLGLDAHATRATTTGADGALWIAPLGDHLLSHYAPQAHALTEVLLRAPIAGFALLPDAGLAVVLHDDPKLAFTLVPDAEPSFATARYVEGRP